MLKQFNKLCDPAKLYFVLVLITLTIGLFSRFSIMAILLKLFFALIWTYILNWICSKGYSSISWILVLLPFILIVAGYFGLAKMSRGSSNPMNMPNLNVNSFYN